MTTTLHEMIEYFSLLAEAVKGGDKEAQKSSLENLKASSNVLTEILTDWISLLKDKCKRDVSLDKALGE